MSTHGQQAVFYLSTPSGMSMSTVMDLGRSWANVYVVMPSLTSQTRHYFHTTPDGLLPSRINHPPANSTSISCHNYTLWSGVTNAVVPIPNGFRYLAIEASFPADNGATYAVICSD